MIQFGQNVKVHSSMGRRDELTLKPNESLMSKGSRNEGNKVVDRSSNEAPF